MQDFNKIASILHKKLSSEIIDIFLIGSSLKNKIVPEDLDIIVLFRNNNLDKAGECLFDIKESLNIKNLHIEPLFADSMLHEGIFSTILHEGFSIREKKYLSELLGVKSYSIFYFNLEHLERIDKVRFAQALYGRKKDGLLYSEKGISLGNGSFMAPVAREEIFKEMMKKWKVNYKHKRAFVSD